jgi:hypothetical protein
VSGRESLLFGVFLYHYFGIDWVRSNRAWLAVISPLKGGNPNVCGRRSIDRNFDLVD